MKYSLFAVVLITLMLTGCKGEGKPGQYPPSLYKERDGLLSDSELEKNKQESAGQESK
ncbi:MAG: hypothetical protein KA524_01905 [Nitrosomonas sp.]|nr:hypothetical protein [Nitrosomonas sp.]MBP6074962.1 hypothetical protein [Nitrosomonas sp.]